MNQLSPGRQPTQHHRNFANGLPEHQMGDAPRGPGWWQASDRKWYPSQHHPGDVAPPPPPGNHVPGATQTPGIPLGPSPQGWPAPYPQNAAGGAQIVSDGLATVKGVAAKLSVTAGLLFGGFVIAAIAIFLPWVTVTADSPLGGNLYKADASPFTGVWRLLVLLVIAGAAWLARPTLLGSQMSVKRLGGLTAVVGLQIVFLLIGLADYAIGVAEKGKAIADTGEELTGLHVNFEFGLALYAAATVAITVGAVRIWSHRSNIEKRAP